MREGAAGIECQRCQDRENSFRKILGRHFLLRFAELGVVDDLNSGFLHGRVDLSGKTLVNIGQKPFDIAANGHELGAR